MHIDRRTFIQASSAVGGLSLLGSTGTAIAQAGAVSLPDCRAAGVRYNDNDALAEALRRGSTIYLPAGQGSGDHGEYYISINPLNNGMHVSGNLKKGTTIYGDGPQTVVIQTDRNIFTVNSLSSDPAANVTDVVIRDMRLYGRSESQDVDQNEHMIALAGTTNALIQNVTFFAFSGDGLYMGSPTRDDQRHNRQVSVQSCVFDGVNNRNRNGIGIVDCTDWKVENCTFRNLTKTGQPGAIDVEPDHPEQINGIGRVANCYFQNCNGYAFTLEAAPPPGPTQTDNYVFEYCRIENCLGGFAHAGFGGDAANDGYAYNVRVEHLSMQTVAHPFLFRGVYNVRFAYNTITDADYSVIDLGALSRDVYILNNTFVRCGSGETGSVIFQRGSVRNAQILNNVAIDCGTTTAPVRALYYLDGIAENTKTTFLRLMNNDIQGRDFPIRMTAYGYIMGGRGRAYYTDVVSQNNPKTPALSGPENLTST